MEIVRIEVVAILTTNLLHGCGNVMLEDLGLTEEDELRVVVYEEVLKHEDIVLQIFTVPC